MNLDENPNKATSGIPISISLNATLEAEEIGAPRKPNKRRLLQISGLAIGIAAVISVVAKLLIYLIDLISNLAFYGKFSVEYISPAANNLGLFVIVVPAIGGIIVGLMAFYGSKAIRGHGIPEAMEQILTNKSKINPAITYLKPLSSAVSIGTGGPFGAEGPIIATGGALGSTIGQSLRISDYERKILLAAGATAGMSAIFGTPIAAIFLAIELLLFEFSPRSMLPVALACITGAAGHHLLFENGPVFAMAQMVLPPSNLAIAGYSIMGLIIGLISVLVTKCVYFIEDTFEKIPVHWMWWPALGGLGVGLIGYFAPRTLGVGYENIIDLLSGSLPLQVILSLCLMKFVSWAIALGSGTSGGTLAPLLTIGGATGVIIGSGMLYFFPDLGITLPLAALVGMAAMFAGASRAFITSIIFALETTMQSQALLPLLAACTGSYIISFFLMRNTIMTEKIARRGVQTPHSYEPDLLEKVLVGKVVKDTGIVLSEDNNIKEVREWLQDEDEHKTNFYIVVTEENEFRGVISASNLFSGHHNPQTKVGALIKRSPVSVGVGQTLRVAVDLMANENMDVLPVVSPDNHVIGLLSYKDILFAYKQNSEEHLNNEPDISLKKGGLRMIGRGQKLFGQKK